MLLEVVISLAQCLLRTLPRHHQIQILHRSSGSALAEVVEYSSQQHLAGLLVFTHHQLQIISPVQRLRIKAGQRFGLLQRHHLDMGRIGVVLHKAFMQPLPVHARRQQAQLQR